jgi:hypothetical protein
MKEREKIGRIKGRNKNLRGVRGVKNRKKKILCQRQRNKTRGRKRVRKII